MNIGDPPVVVDDDEEWFGDGSAFDSGEELAEALFAMAGPVAATAVAPSIGLATDADELVEDEGFVVRPTPRVPLPPPLEHEFHLLGDPRPRAANDEEVQVFIRPVGPQPPRESAQSWGLRAAKTEPVRRVGRGWSMRNSVHVLKTTEDVIVRLREDAVAITWNAARVAVTHSDDKLCKQLSLS